MKLSNLYFLGIAILSLLSVTIIYATKLAFPPIRSDGIGYYSYLPSIFIHKSLNFEDLVVERFEEEPLEKMPEYGQLRTAQEGSLIPEFWTGLRYYPQTEKYVNQYPIGEAILVLPFFLVAHILTFTFGIDSDGGFGPIYQLAGGFAGIFYFWCGVYFAFKILTQKFSKKVAYISLIALIFGTNLFHYATYDSIFSHSYSFFVITLLVYLIPKWYSAPNYKNSMLLASTYALVFLLRPTNAISLLLFVFYDIKGFGDFTRKVKFFIQKYRYLLLMFTLGVILALPLFFYYKYAFDKWFVVSYRDFEGFDFSKPQLANSLFSARKGLFFWSPALLLGVAGLFKMKHFKEFRLSIVITLIFATWIITSWWHWPYGGSFGHRAYVDWFILFLIPIAEIVKWSQSKKYFYYLVLGFILFAVLLTTKLMIQYWLGVIEIDGTTLAYYFDNFFNFEYRR